jgi:16S rRNA (guanine527-N7)-methyltransferase
MNPLWTDIAARADVSLSADQHALLGRYLDLLLEANQTMNLTRITDRPQAELLHVADSLTVLPFLPAGEHRLADLGSGGGVPGIPLAIARPDVRVLLIESTKKKAAFLRRAVEQLGLANAHVSEDRVEDVARTGRREVFDVVTARAVALLPWLIEWAVPLLKKGGVLLAMKGERAAEEIVLSERAYKRLNASAPVATPIELPGTEKHVIVRVTKLGATHESYPRPATSAKGKHL